MCCWNGMCAGLIMDILYFQIFSIQSLIVSDMASHSHGGGGAAAADEDERDLALAKKHSVSDMASHSSHGGGGAAYVSDNPDDDLEELVDGERTENEENAAVPRTDNDNAAVPRTDNAAAAVPRTDNDNAAAAVARTDNDIIKAALEHPIGEKRPDFNQWASPSFSFNYFCKLPNSQFAVCLSCKTLNSKLAEGKPRRKEQFATPCSSTSG